MFWKALTDVVVFLHGFWVVAVVVGPVWAWKNKRFRAVHLGMLWWTFFVLASGIYCPVSHLENSFRMHYDPSGSYPGGFVVHYVNRMTSWDLTQPQVVSAMIFWTFLWTAVYVFLWTKKAKPSPESRK
ncbi:MAG TPA: DUF2784 family protein [Elusimicrobiota bacterium]|nr:DUF2784 family protein [Elusimicrobiota bacterium]